MPTIVFFLHSSGGHANRKKSKVSFYIKDANNKITGWTQLSQPIKRIINQDHNE